MCMRTSIQRCQRHLNLVEASMAIGASSSRIKTAYIIVSSIIPISIYLQLNYTVRAMSSPRTGEGEEEGLMRAFKVYTTEFFYLPDRI